MTSSSVRDRLGALGPEARFYVIPVGPTAALPPTVFGAGIAGLPVSGLRLGGSALGYVGVRLVARTGTKRLVDHYVPAAQLPSILDCLSEDIGPAFLRRLSALAAPRPPLALGGSQQLPFTRPRIMGVLNVTPDSFSDGGQFMDPEKAITHGRAMTAAGADIIDVGGESTRPGATPVWEGDEEERVVPVIKALVSEGITVSVDTRHATVMTAALEAGAHILNDVSALSYDPGAIEVASDSVAPIVLMHAKGDPATMQDAPIYSDVVLDVFDWLEGRVKACIDAGIEPSRLILDPGIGFGKRVIADNLALLNDVSIFHTLGAPLLIGASRKRFIGAVTGVEAASDRMAGSLAVAGKMIQNGVQIVRVHDVSQTRQIADMMQAFIDGAAMDAAKIEG